MSVPFERRLSILSQDEGLLMVKINLFEANWTHFDAKLLVITNVTWSNILNKILAFCQVTEVYNYHMER